MTDSYGFTIIAKSCHPSARERQPASGLSLVWPEIEIVTATVSQSHRGTDSMVSVKIIARQPREQVAAGGDWDDADTLTITKYFEEKYASSRGHFALRVAFKHGKNLL